MIETIKTIQEATENKKENLCCTLELPEVRDIRQMTPSDEQLEQRAELSAQLACRFFGLPDGIIKKGDDILVKMNDTEEVSDDVLEYNVEAFKNIGCTSLSDMTKVWFHECGHRLLQDIYPNSWTDELGADFFAGVVSELTGLPKGNMERFLAVQNPSESHPGGSLRLMAMDYGRFVASEMKAQGITPTWENCIEAFKTSPFPDLVKDDIPMEDPEKGARFYGPLDPPTGYYGPLDPPPVTINNYATGSNTFRDIPWGTLVVNPNSPFFKYTPSTRTITERDVIDIHSTEGLRKAGVDLSTPSGQRAANFLMYDNQMANIRYKKLLDDFQQARNPGNYRLRGHFTPPSAEQHNSSKEPSKIGLFNTDIASRINAVKEFFNFRHLDGSHFEWFTPKEKKAANETKVDTNNHRMGQMGLNLYPKIGEFAKQNDLEKR